MPVDIDSEGEREASYVRKEGMREMAGVRQNREMKRKRGIQRESVRARQLTDTAETGCSRRLHYLPIHFL